MSFAHHRLTLPEALQNQLLDFRRRVWTIKLMEAVGGALTGVLLAYLATFVLDRFLDTPESVRLGIFVTAVVCCGLIPVALHRWVWKQRKLEQLARLLAKKHPSVGDQLLGIIELVHSESEQARSLALCEAAVKQVSTVAEQRDFRDSVPEPKHRRRLVLAGLAASVAVVLLGLCPAAAMNAWARFLMPWGDTPRYTFTSIQPLPNQMNVAHGEPFSVKVQLASHTVWHPATGEVRLGGQAPMTARLHNGAYEFELPPQIDAAWMTVRIGDLKQQVRIEPTLRPELSSVAATVELPKYVGRDKPLRKDVRGGTLSLVKGSRVTFVATATRPLASAHADGKPLTLDCSKFTTPAIDVDESRKLELTWQDEYGLAGKEPFTLTINSREDDAPSLSCEDLPRQRVVLDSETLNFKVRAQDDFGVKVVGIEWQGIDTTNFKNPAKGERILAAGGPDKELLALVGTFSAKSLGIEPQPIQVRMFVEDYYPGRERVYSSTYLFYVLDPEQHAIWITEMLSKWHRQSLEVRDKELSLHETNKAIRELSPEELDQPDTRQRIETQAAAERANGRRLSNLVANGEDLVKQAMRNPEIGVGHLEKWAEMLNILKDISGNRMPSVADLLKQAAQSPKLASNQTSPSNKAPSAGQVRAATPGSQSSGEDDKPKPPAKVPSINDVESTHGFAKKDDQQNSQSPPSSGSSRLTLPSTTLLGPPGKGNASCPADQKLDEAVQEQADLLAEFEKLSEELNKVLGNLEGSTLVKRLKAASRHQYKIAGRLGDEASAAFGVPEPAIREAQRELFRELAAQEAKSTIDISNIMDDLQSYFERRRMMTFKTVLDDMRAQDVIGALRQLTDDLKKENGLSMAQCEYWSDTLDRWAEDLVDPASGGT